MDWWGNVFTELHFRFDKTFCNTKKIWFKKHAFSSFGNEFEIGDILRNCYWNILGSVLQKNLLISINWLSSAHVEFSCAGQWTVSMAIAPHGWRNVSRHFFVDERISNSPTQSCAKSWTVTVITRTSVKEKTKGTF